MSATYHGPSPSLLLGARERYHKLNRKALREVTYRDECARRITNLQVTRLFTEGRAEVKKSPRHAG
ncbi:MAG: hypothetical protein ACRDOK_02940, partial [Streptosporangiaceae bacterium]